MLRRSMFLLKLFIISGCIFFLSCEHTSNPSSTPAQGMVSWWEAEGNAGDRIGANDGVLENGTSFGPGVRGRGFLFDGVDDYVEITGAPSLDLQSFTVDCWIFIDPAQSSQEFNIFVSKNDGSSAGGGFFLAHDDRNLPPGVLGAEPGETTNSLRFMVFESHSVMSRTFLTDAFPVAGFYHLAGAFDGSMARLFLNGALVATGGAIDSVAFNQFNLRFGASYANEVYGIDDHFEGTIDEVRIFNRALSANEIQAMHNLY